MNFLDFIAGSALLVSSLLSSSSLVSRTGLSQLDFKTTEGALKEAGAVLRAFDLREHHEDPDAFRLRVQRVIDAMVVIDNDERVDAIVPTLQALARTAFALSDPQRAAIGYARCTELYARDHSHDDPYLLDLQGDLAAAYSESGQLEDAVQILTEIVPLLRSLHVPGHEGTIRNRRNLAVTLMGLNRFDEARGVIEGLLIDCESTSGVPDLTVAECQNTLANVLRNLGQHEDALVMVDLALEGFSKNLPVDHEKLLLARVSRSSILGDLRMFDEEFAILEEVIPVLEARLPEDDRVLIGLRENFAGALGSRHDYARAAVLMQRVLEARLRILPRENPEVARALLNLGVAQLRLGQVDTARATCLEALGAFERAHGRRHTVTLEAMRAVASADTLAGNHERALELLEEIVVLSDELGLPLVRRLQARGNLLGSLTDCSLTERALRLGEELLKQTRGLAQDHPERILIHGNMALALRNAGQFERACDLFEDAITSLETISPPGSTYLQGLRRSLAFALAAMQDGERCGVVLERVLDESLECARDSAWLSMRERREFSQRSLPVLDLLYSLAGIVDTVTEDQFFELGETLRALHDLPQPKRGQGADVREQRLRAEIAGLSTSSRDEATLGLLAASFERDRLEAELRRQLVARRPSTPESISVKSVQAALPAGTVAVAYRVIDDLTVSRSAPQPSGTMKLIAHVVTQDALSRIDLGPLADVELLVATWLKAVGAYAGESALANADVESQAGADLRRRVIDPLLPLAESARALHVVMDGPLTLVPMDALPFGEGVVGDVLRIHTETSFGRLTRPAGPRATEGGALVLGDIAYGPRAGTELGTVLTFAHLPGSRAEVDGVFASLERLFPAAADRLTGEAATKATLLDVGPSARVMHIATHAYVAPEAQVVGTPRSTEAMHSIPAIARAVAPLTLCGLALAGANGGPDAIGRVPGVITAEELAALDLSSCELTVLAGCATGLGLRHSGLGVDSLRTALHSAGVRSVVTTVWPIVDAHAHELMAAFYQELEVDGIRAADALWRAKASLRARRKPTIAWAGWVISGAPN